MGGSTEITRWVPLLTPTGPQTKSMDGMPRRSKVRKMGRVFIFLSLVVGLTSVANAQRTERSTLWREWATIESQWQIERRAIAQDRKRLAARIADVKKTPPPAPKKKSK